MNNSLPELAKLLRFYILMATTAAGSGHPTSSLSAVELMATLFFDGFFKFDLENKDFANNDRIIFSKGHAAPLFYALYAAAGKVSLDELQTLRQLNSDLEGHPMMDFPFTEAATGSLGQGLSVGVGMALNAKYLDQVPYMTYVLLGDGELMEGQNWEALEIAAHYKLNNLVGILDVNQFGQTGETSAGWSLEKYQYKIAAFGWQTAVIDGHDFGQIQDAFHKAQESDQPTMIIAKTVKGKGISFIENDPKFHGKALSEDQLSVALAELGEIDESLIGEIALPEKTETNNKVSNSFNPQNLVAPHAGKLAPRKAYGNALVKLGATHPNLVVLDADVSNSTYAQTFKRNFPERFFEMYIAEQNMVSTAVGLAQRGKNVFVSTFGAFLTRAFDQIRMAQYSQANLKLVGSHVGVSIGKDGASQMALEDIAMMRSIRESVIFYPSDAFSTEKLTELMAGHKGISYLRITRENLPLIYDDVEDFEIGGSKVLRSSSDDVLTVVAAGITLHESLKAYKQLMAEGTNIRVIDLYSLKPLDEDTLKQAAQETGQILTVEDHYQFGGLGEAVKVALSGENVKVESLFVNKMPHSGSMADVLSDQEIDAAAIVKKIKEMANGR